MELFLNRMGQSFPVRVTQLIDGWWIVITDVAGSKLAIEAVRHKDVNTIGLATLAAAQPLHPWPCGRRGWASRPRQSR